MSDILPRWFAEYTDRLMAIDGLVTRRAEEDEEDEEDEKKDKEEEDDEDEDEDDGYSE